MKFKHQEVQNIVVILIAQGTAAVAAIATFLQIATKLSVVEYGRYEFAASSTVFFGLFAELGVRYVSIREVTLQPDRAKQVFWNATIVRWLLSIAALLLLVIATLLFNPWSGERQLLIIAGILAMMQFTGDPATWVLFGQGRADLAGAILILDRIIYLVSISVAAAVTQNAEGIVVGAVLANLIRTLLAWLWIRHRVQQQVYQRWDWTLLRRLIADGSALGIAVMMSVTYAQLTIVIIQAAAPAQELGYYSVAFAAVSVLLIVPQSLLIALFPNWTSASSREERAKLYKLVAWLNIVILLPLAVAMILFAEEFMTILFGVRYKPAVIILRILAAASIVSAISVMYRLILFAMNKPWRETLIDGWGILLTLAIGFLVAQRNGGPGLAVVYFIVELTVVFIKVAATWKLLGPPTYLRLLFLCGISVLIPALVVSSFVEGLLLRLTIYSLGTVSLLLIFRVIPPEQVNSAARLINRWSVKVRIINSRM